MKQWVYVLISGIAVAAGFVALDLIFLENPQITVQRVISSFLGGAVFMLIYYNFVLKRKEKRSGL
ncbi:hypothetical protein ABC345_21405 [Shouchella sp. 1P09AA]|uniref:hypothetical protein n=1 Tax=unclassified Shouchella TaxID=2893065 RepID=UPI00399F207D